MFILHMGAMGVTSSSCTFGSNMGNFHTSAFEKNTTRDELV